MRIGQLIFQNECASKKHCLTSWNEGEDFASLGIGHFIWYPEGVNKNNQRFDESFPKLLRWMQNKGVEIPAWLQKQQGNPWKNRRQFKKVENTQKMRALRDFLLETSSFQVEFMKNRLKNALPSILKHLPVSQRAHIQEQFQHVAHSPMGFYALMDYVNFKGEGIKTSERYQGKGWGLLQVLEHMQSTKSGLQAIQDFSASAVLMLTQRVALSPTSRHEKRWLPGWKKRIKSYVYEGKQQLKTHPKNIQPL
ncbi:MAG: hypothetical protein COB41_01945 [Proteobacteria bacterium]|nr:MAG: hypothetical protein COB41_01945 [Pseudomonadota bacterium]